MLKLLNQMLKDRDVFQIVIDPDGTTLGTAVRDAIHAESQRIRPRRRRPKKFWGES